MSLIFRDTNLPWGRTPLVGAPKASESIHGEFVDTAQPTHTPRGFLPTQHPEAVDPRHDAQAAYDPDALPVQNVRNPCEGADYKRPMGWLGATVYLGSAALVLALAGWAAGLLP
jgi:hypothetical protein